MSPYAERILDQLRETEASLAREAEEQQRRWHYRLHCGRVWFDEELSTAHRRLKQSALAYIREGSVLSLLTAPIIYSLVVPLALLDVWVTAYQWTCFPVYGIAHVRRGDYRVVDRHKLAYLNGIEKANCTFCSYAQGLVAYVREVASRTEQYWCPIKHAHPIPAPHSRYRLFFEYGDAESYRHDLAAQRLTLRSDGRSAGRIKSQRRRERIRNPGWGNR